MAIEEPLNDYFDKGLDIIQRTRELRKKINKEIYFVENASFRLSQVPNDEYWTNEKEKHLKELESYKEETAVLETELHYLKDTMDYDFYKLLLQNYGHVLAATSPIPHVEESMYDEFELNKALSATAEAIKIKQAELEKAINEDNKDYAVVLSAEIKFYRDDMKKHFWGVQRLEKIDEESIKDEGKIK